MIDGRSVTGDRGRRQPRRVRRLRLGGAGSELRLRLGLGSSATRAPIDLWDTAWPNGGYYWTVVPVVIEHPPGSPTSIQYRDVQLPQDACQSRNAGAILRFGKVSQPVVAASGAPYVSGLTTEGPDHLRGREAPTFYGPPLVAWSPALGADSYEVQWSKAKYPWKAGGTVATYSTSRLLPLKPGLWYYRIRGVDPSIPGAKQQMSWTEPLALRVAKPTFRIVRGR